MSLSHRLKIVSTPSPPKTCSSQIGFLRFATSGSLPIWPQYTNEDCENNGALFCMKKSL